MELTAEHLTYLGLASICLGLAATVMASVAISRTHEHNIPCGEPGPPGMMGPRGMMGDRGPVGPQGLPGKDAVAPQSKPRGRPRKAKTQNKKPRDKQG